MLRSRSRKFWKGQSRSRKFWKGRSRSWSRIRIFCLRLRNPGVLWTSALLLCEKGAIFRWLLRNTQLNVLYCASKNILTLRINARVFRLVEMFSRRLQVQERLTKQIAHALTSTLEPHGVAVTVEASWVAPVVFFARVKRVQLKPSFAMYIVSFTLK